MLVFRNAVHRMMCDGCFSIIDEAIPRFVHYRTKDGREGHVCSEECAVKFEDNPPHDGRLRLAAA